MFRSVSVKKLFFVLLAAIVVLLLIFLFHGPFLADGVEEAVAQAVLDRAEQQESGDWPAEGHRIFQATRSQDLLEVWGVFSYGRFNTSPYGPVMISGTVSAPARLTFVEDKWQGWSLVEYWEPTEGNNYQEELKESFPLHLRPLAALSGLFRGSLKKQMLSYAP